MSPTEDGSTPSNFRADLRLQVHEMPLGLLPRSQVAALFSQYALPSELELCNAEVPVPETQNEGVLAVKSLLTRLAGNIRRMMEILQQTVNLGIAPEEKTSLQSLIDEMRKTSEDPELQRLSELLRNVPGHGHWQALGQVGELAEELTDLIRPYVHLDVSEIFERETASRSSVRLSLYRSRLGIQGGSMVRMRYIGKDTACTTLIPAGDDSVEQRNSKLDTLLSELDKYIFSSNKINEKYTIATDIQTFAGEVLEEGNLATAGILSEFSRRMWESAGHNV